MKKISYSFLAIITWFFLTGATAGLQVKVESGKLSVHAKDVPLSKILAAIDDQAQVKFVTMCDPKAIATKISQNFSNLPLERGIAKLLKGYDYSMVADETGVPSKILILSVKSQKGSAGKPRSKAVTSKPSKTSKWAVQSEDKAASAIQTAKNAVNPEEQVKALRRLGDFQDSRTLEAIQPALASEDVEVRNAALEAMRWNSVEDPSALDDVRKLAAEDPDPNVRRSALEVLIRYDDTQQGRELLEELAQDEDSTFRDFARQELVRMDEEASATDNQLQLVDEKTATDGQLESNQ